MLTGLWLYQVTVVSGRFEDLRATLHRISADPRAQAVVIAFCFGGLLEALAGFGAPVAITAVMLTAIGLPALRAAIVVLVANTAPVAFGAIAIPIITAGNLTGIPYQEIGAYVGRQTPLLAAVVPLLLVLLVDGWRGVRETWALAVTVGISFGIAQFLSANFVSVELTDIIASLVGLAAAVLVLRRRQPRGGEEARERLGGGGAGAAAVPGAAGPPSSVAVAEREAPAKLTASRTAMALLPYLLVVGLFSLAKLWLPLSEALPASDVSIPWPGLAGRVDSSSVVYTFSWLSSPGTPLLISGVVVAIAYRVPLRKAAGELVGTA